MVYQFGLVAHNVALVVYSVFLMVYQVVQAALRYILCLVGCVIRWSDIRQSFSQDRSRTILTTCFGEAAKLVETFLKKFGNYTKLIFSWQFLMTVSG